MFVFRERDNSRFQSGLRSDGAGVCTAYEERGEEADRHSSASVRTAELAG